MKSKEFFIYNKDVPRWDIKKKHYYEQSLEVIDFYTEELRKCNEGITIDGVFIHPWLYYHLNFFKTPIPREDGSEPIITPDLRDNEWYLAEMLKKAQDAKKNLFLFGSRRWAKSVMETSILDWASKTKRNSTSEIICGSANDLATIGRFLKISNTYVHPAFRLPMNKSDYTKHLQFGYKEQGTGAPIAFSDVFIKNADAGKASSSEKGAGGAPQIVIIDEAGKFAFLDLYQSLLPALQTPYGQKGIILLSGTSGNEKLSKDAFKVLSNPDAYKIMPMDWDVLNKRVPPKHRTWVESQFGMFLPAQMAYEENVVKDKTNLSDYLSVESKGLKDLRIDVTNWERSTKVYKDNRTKLEKDKDSLNKEIMYHPLDPQECFLSGVNTPFPVNEARLHRLDLIERGDIGKNAEIFKKEGNALGYELSNLDRVPFPFEGGIHNAPVVLYEDPPERTPEKFEFVSGLDPYKAKESNTDSAGAMYVVKRKLNIKQPIEIIVASYVSRPTTQGTFNRTCQYMIEGWNAECLMENSDQSLIQYLEERNKVHILADGIEWAKAINPLTKAKTTIGYSPTPKNQAFIYSLVIDYCWQEIETGLFDANGEHIYKLGVTFIKDPELLQEIIDYKPGMNADRIIAFGSALAWARHLDTLRIVPRVQQQDDKESQRKKEEKRRAAKVQAKQMINIKKRF